MTTLMLFLLIGCQSNDEKTYKVITPLGSPMLSQVYVQKESKKFSTDTVSGAEPLQAAFISGEYDFIFAPTNLGAKFYNNTSNYQLAATVVLGGSYIASIDTKLSSINDLEDKAIVAYGKNQTGDIILKYILQSLNIKVKEIQYVTSVADASVHLTTNKDAIILTAEPNLSLLKLNNKDISVIDLQALYHDITGVESYPQASVFVKKTTDKKVVKEYLKLLKKSIEKVNSKPKETSELANELGYEIKKEAIEISIPKTNIKYFQAQNAKEMIILYLDLLKEFNPNILDKLPDDDFYYQL